MKTKVLLIWPKTPSSYWSFAHLLPYTGKKSILPPLGVLTVAALLPENYDPKVIDMNVSDLSRRDIAETDLVFLSGMIAQQHSFNEVVQLCHDCGTPVVAGGTYATSSHEIIKGVDHFVLNEAEITLPKFLHDYERGDPKKIYLDDTRPDITRTPPPRFELLDMSAYMFMTLQYSRGCPYNCEFCDIIEMFGRKVRTKLAEQFIHEMECIYNSGFRGNLFLADDNFVADKKKVKDLLRKIIEWQKIKGYPFDLATQASIDLAKDDELLDLMEQAGFTVVFVGIETPDPHTLALIQKKQNLQDDIHQSVKKIQRKGMQVSGGFILGFDSDPENIFDLQIEFIQRAGIPMAMVGMLEVLPKTQLYRRLKKENRLTTDMVSSGDHVELTLNYIPKMGRKRLISGFKQVLSQIYSTDNYFERSLTLLERMPGKLYANQYRRRRYSLHMAVFFAKIGIRFFLKNALTAYGIASIRFIKKALLINKGQYNLAFFLAVVGYHFKMMTDDILLKNFDPKG